jgi:hypothetical protein
MVIFKALYSGRFCVVPEEDWDEAFDDERLSCESSWISWEDGGLTSLCNIIGIYLGHNTVHIVMLSRREEKKPVTYFYVPSDRTPGEPTFQKKFTIGIYNFDQHFVWKVVS